MIGRRQYSQMKDASGDHVDITTEDGMVYRKVTLTGCMSHNDGLVAALAGPSDVTENMVRVVCDMLETWGLGVHPQVSKRTSRDCAAERCCRDKASQERFGVCSLTCQNETAEITLQSTTGRTRRVKTILRSTPPRYLHNSLGYCIETALCKDPPHVGSRPQIRQRKTCGTDNHTVHSHKDVEQLSLFKWMSNDYHDVVANFSELIWFSSTAKQSKLAEQWQEVHWIGKLKRADDQNRSKNIN